MLKSRRRVALGISAAASVASMIALATPAQAISPPLWPAAGRIPSGCASTTVSLGATDYQYTFTDTADPAILDLSFGGKTTIVVPPAGVTSDLRVRVRDLCSGTLGVVIGLKRNGAPIILSESLPNAPANVFDGWWAEAPATYRPSDSGYYTVPWGGTTHRWDSFLLDGDFKLVSKVDNSSGPNGAQVGAWSLKRIYVLNATTLTPSAPASVRKGRIAKATAVLKYATNAGYVADAGAKVSVQTKVGTGKWLTNATLTTNASGVASYSFVVNATTSVRFIHVTTLSGKYTNGAISAIKVVKKI